MEQRTVAQELTGQAWSATETGTRTEQPTAAGTGKARWRLLAGAAVLLGLLLASWLLPTKELLTAVLSWTQSLGLWGPVLLAIFYVVACVLLIPGSLLTLGAGALFGLWWGYLAVSVGSVLGACLAFLLGRTIGREWVAGKVAGSTRFQAIDEAVGEQGFKIVLLTRLSPVFPFNLQNYAYGVTRVSFRDYILASWVGMIPGTLLYVYLGSAAKGLAELAIGSGAGGSASAGTAQTVFFLIGLLATLAVTVLITRIARKALRHAIEQ